MPKRLRPSKLLRPGIRRPASGVSLTEGLFSELARAIRKEGGEKSGDLLPSERELAGRFRLGRVTVRNALGRLVREGLVEPLPGLGYRILPLRKGPQDLRPVGLIYRGLSWKDGQGSFAIQALETLLAEKGRALLVGFSGQEATREDDCIRRFRQAGACALIVAPAVSGTASRELETWIKQKRALVLHGHPGHWLLPDALAARCDQVDVDNAGGVRQVLDHLRSLGHQHFGFLQPGAPKHSERLAAFETWLKEKGLERRAEWIVTSLAQEKEGGREGFRALAATAAQPTAVLCASDDVALGCIEAARAAGRRVPEDLSVGGFGNESLEGPGALKELTTVDFSREEDAAETVRLLDLRSRGEAGPPVHARLPMRLVVRGSCESPFARTRI